MRMGCVDMVNMKIKAWDAFRSYVSEQSMQEGCVQRCAGRVLNIQTDLQSGGEFWRGVTEGYMCGDCRHVTGVSNAFNAMCVKTVGAMEGYTFEVPITFINEST